MGWLLYFIGGLMVYFISDPDIAAWGIFIFIAGMLFHWKFWGLFIAGFMGGFLITRD